MTVTHEFIYFDVISNILLAEASTPAQSSSLITYHMHNISDYLVNDSVVRKTTETAIEYNIGILFSFLISLGKFEFAIQFPLPPIFHTRTTILTIIAKDDIIYFAHLFVQYPAG